MTCHLTLLTICQNNNNSHHIYPPYQPNCLSHICSSHQDSGQNNEMITSQLPLKIVPLLLEKEKEKGICIYTSYEQLLIANFVTQELPRTYRPLLMQICHSHQHSSQHNEMVASQLFLRIVLVLLEEEIEKCTYIRYEY